MRDMWSESQMGSIKMKSDMRFKDRFDNLIEAQAFLDAAESNASTDYEINFVSNMTENFKSWGLNSFLSASQFELLAKIGEGKR